MKEEVLIDYAMPLMNVERFAQRVHHLCLEHRYEEAQENTLKMIVEARLLQMALQHMKEKQ